MFKPLKAKSPTVYLNSLSEPRKSELKALDKLIQKIMGQKPFIISGMLGYGPYHYVGKSGREGDWAAVGLANQKNYISLYACMAYDDGYVAEGYKKLLPKASIGKSCVRFKKLTDVDVKILTKLLIENNRIYKGQLKKQKSKKE